MKVSGSDIEAIRDEFDIEYAKLISLLYAESDDKREVDIDKIKVCVDKCILELKQFKSLKTIKSK